MSQTGNLEEVQHLIKSGVRVDCTDEVRVWVIVTSIGQLYIIITMKFVTPKYTPTCSTAFVLFCFIPNYTSLYSLE